MIKIDLSFIKRLISQSDIDEEILLSDKMSMQLHRSFGNVVDFQFSKNSIFIIESKKGMNES